MSDKADPILQQKEQQQLKTQLLWRLGIAGTLIAGVLAAITWFDRDKKIPAPQVQIPQIAPIVATSQPIVASQIASIAPAATIDPSPAPSPSINPTDTPNTAPNQTQIEAITNVPKKKIGVIPAKAASINPPVAQPPIAITATTPVRNGVEAKQNLTAPSLTVNPSPQAITATISNSATTQLPAAINSQSGFSLQAGSFLQAINAQKLLGQIQAAGVPAYLETRVQIGPFKSKADADIAVKKLRKLGIESIIRTD